MSTAPPPWNGPLLVRAQAMPAIGLAASVEVDTSETGSPVSGTSGNHLNEAIGPAREGTVAGVMIGGAVTVNVTGSLLPAGFPRSEPTWVATAVYCPLDRAGLARVRRPALWEGPCVGDRPGGIA